MEKLLLSKIFVPDIKSVEKHFFSKRIFMENTTESIVYNHNIAHGVYSMYQHNH